MKQVRFVSYDRYTVALQAAHVVLDTFPYGGCLTTHDALSNAVPSVTLPLEHVRGRYTLSMYAQIQSEVMAGLAARKRDGGGNAGGDMGMGPGSGDGRHRIDDGDDRNPYGRLDEGLKYQRGYFEYAGVLIDNLVAHNVSHYVALTLTIIRSDRLRDDLSAGILSGFNDRFHHNDVVAREWLGFILRVFRPQLHTEFAAG
jgi:hypothetical protein